MSIVEAAAGNGTEECKLGVGDSAATDTEDAARAPARAPGQLIASEFSAAVFPPAVELELGRRKAASFAPTASSAKN